MLQEQCCKKVTAYIGYIGYGVHWVWGALWEGIYPITPTHTHHVFWGHSLLQPALPQLCHSATTRSHFGGGVLYIRCVIAASCLYSFILGDLST